MSLMCNKKVIKIKSMPAPIKNKIRQLQKACEKSNRLYGEILAMLNEYGVGADVLLGNCDYTEKEKYTEALSFVLHVEGDVEDNIRSIEEVFLHYVNK